MRDLAGLLQRAGFALPVADAAANLRVALTDPAGIAAASPLQASADPTNLGSARPASTTVDDATAFAGFGGATVDALTVSPAVLDEDVGYR